jgi:cytochrome b561
MAVLIFVQLWIGWRISVTDAGYDKKAAYDLHASLGLLVLGLAVLRLGWRLAIPRPESTDDVSGLERAASEAAFWLFYLLMLALPVSGWIMVSATAREAVSSMFGVAPWPHVKAFETLAPEARQWWEDAAQYGHQLMVWGMMGLIALHVAAALKHQFWNCDKVLKRMIPIIPARG